MKRILAIALTVVMLVSTIGMSGTAVAAQDEYPEGCGASDFPILDSGQYSGSIDTPDDDDAFGLRLDKGEMYSVRMVVPSEQHSFRFWLPSDYSLSPTSLSNVDDGDTRAGYLGDFEPGLEATWELFAEEDGVHCVEVEEFREDSADIPYQWQLSLEKNDPEPAGFEVTELRQQIDSLQSEVSDLESQIESKNERISQLESQLENADVVIDVSVEPEDQATFQVGGAMAVDVNAQEASPSDVTLNFAGQEYTASGGEATIPLDSAGTQQLDINYQDTTETITLDVADQEEDTATDGDSSTDGGADDGSASSDDDGSTTDDDSGTTDDGSTDGSADDDGAGFGIVAALVALSGIGLLSHRQLTSESDQ